MIIDNDTGSNSKDSFCSSKSKSTDNNETQDIEINPKINEKLKNNIPKIKKKKIITQKKKIIIIQKRKRILLYILNYQKAKKN